MSKLSEYKKRLKNSQDLSESHWTRSIENYKHYFSKLDTGASKIENYPFHSQMTVPISYEVVETVMPRLIGKDPEFAAVAIEPSDVESEAMAKMAIEMAYNNPKLEMLGEPIYLKLYRGVKEQLITGNMVLRPFWRRQTTKRMQYRAYSEKTGHKDMDPVELYKKLSAMNMQDSMKYTKKEMEVPFLDDFDIRHVPFWMFFPDVPMIEPGKMRYKIEREYMTPEQLIDEAEIFGYDKVSMKEVLDFASDRKRMAFTPDIRKEFMQDYYDLFAPTQSSVTFSTDDDRVPLLIVDKMWEGGRVHVFVNEKWGLTGETGIKSPYDLSIDPFIFGHDNPLPHSYHSYGEIDAIKKLEDGMNDLLNMRFDNLVQSMLNYWFYNPNYLDDDADGFQPVPNSVTPTKDVNNVVRVINGPNVTGTAYQEAKEILDIIQRTTGVNDYAKGIEGESLAGRTYGGMRLVQEMANARFIVKSRLFEKVTLKSLGYFALEMSRQFITKDRMHRQFGETMATDQKLEAHKLKAIKGFMDIKVVPNSTRVIDEQAEAVRLSSVTDRMIAQADKEKGPFTGMPDELYDKLLLKMLPLYGINDAPYWVRAIQENRKKMEKEVKKTDPAKQPPAAPLPPQQPVGPGGIAGLLGGTGLTTDMVPTLQSDQVAMQPDPLASIINSGVQ